MSDTQNPDTKGERMSETALQGHWQNAIANWVSRNFVWIILGVLLVAFVAIPISISVTR